MSRVPQQKNLISLTEDKTRLFMAAFSLLSPALHHAGHRTTNTQLRACILDAALLTAVFVNTLGLYAISFNWDCDFFIRACVIQFCGSHSSLYKIGTWALAAVAQWIQCWPVDPSVAGSMPSLEHKPGLWARAPVGLSFSWCFSPFLSPSFPLSKNTYIHTYIHILKNKIGMWEAVLFTSQPLTPEEKLIQPRVTNYMHLGTRQVVETQEIPSQI